MKRVIAFVILFSLVCLSLCLTNVEAKKKTHTVTFNAYNGKFKAKTNVDKKTIKFKYKHNEKRGESKTESLEKVLLFLVCNAIIILKLAKANRETYDIKK